MTTLQAEIPSYQNQNCLEQSSNCLLIHVANLYQHCTLQLHCSLLNIQQLMTKKPKVFQFLVPHFSIVTNFYAYKSTEYARTRSFSITIQKQHHLSSCDGIALYFREILSNRKVMQLLHYLLGSFIHKPTTNLLWSQTEHLYSIQ